MIDLSTPAGTRLFLLTHHDDIFEVELVKPVSSFGQAAIKGVDEVVIFPTSAHYSDLFVTKVEALKQAVDSVTKEVAVAQYVVDRATLKLEGLRKAWAELPEAEDKSTKEYPSEDPYLQTR